MTAVDTHQLDLFGPWPCDPQQRTIEQAFRDFHHTNPDVYRELCALARDLVDRGHRRIGIGLLFEVLRWQRMMTTRGDEFKLNNNYRSRYVRLIERNEADLAGVFTTRELRSA